MLSTSVGATSRLSAWILAFFGLYWLQRPNLNSLFRAPIRKGFAISIWFGNYKRLIPRSFRHSRFMNKPKSTRKYLFDLMYWNSLSVATYKETRNGLVGVDYSTKFSPWLALGCLSPRKIFWEVKNYEKSEVANKSTYWVIFELIWRDYFKFVCLHYGDSVFYLTGKIFLKISWFWEAF